MGRHVLPVSAVGIVGALLFLICAGRSVSSTAATLSFRATLMTDGVSVACPPSAPPDADCRARTGKGTVSGLGSISAAYTWFFASGSDCPSNLVKPFATTARFIVAGKGSIDFAIADGPRCVDVEPVRNEPQEFTITGGTRRYQGASGRGKIERSLSGGRGLEWWEGTLNVAGLDFDTTPPIITGAVAKTIKAPARVKRVRVTYKPTAQDAVDGSLTVACTPASGSFFRIGRTAVSCTASDASGNARTARFVVTVRR